jgi:hypothetical protein
MVLGEFVFSCCGQPFSEEAFNEQSNENKDNLMSKKEGYNFFLTMYRDYR